MTCRSDLFHRLGLIGALMLLFSIPSFANDLEKAFEVNSQGAATYKFDMELPPGTAGVRPNIGLSYNHQSGVGLLGYQWNLTGLSYITRCSQNLAQDSLIRPVRMNQNDRFCLQGQRLVAISGAYGADQTIYRTERESWTKVVSFGNCNNGPCRFVAYQKDGNTVEFDAFNVAAGKPALLWATSKVTDRNGNYWTASYTNDQNSIYPSTLAYTSNDAVNLSATRTLSFQYQDSFRPKTTYLAGIRQITRKVLKRVEIKVDDSLVRSYEFNFLTRANNQAELLQEIVECNASQACRRIAKFSYNSSQDGFQNSASFATPDGIFLTEKEDLNIKSKGVFRDFNGDSIPDYSPAQCLEGQTVCQPDIYLGNGSGFQLAPYKLPGGLFLSKSDDWVSLNTGVLEDINGDGLVDYVEASCQKGQSCEQAIYLNTGSGFQKANYALPHALTTLDFEDYLSQNLGLLMDVTGDNRVDFISSYRFKDGGQQNKVFVNNGQGFVYTGMSLPDIMFYNSSEDMQGRAEAILEDLNGDGLPDFSNASCDEDGNNCKLQVYYATGSGWNPSSHFLPGAMIVLSNEGFQARPSAVLRDFNADGLVDFSFASCVLEDGADEDSAAQDCNLRIHFNTGVGFVASNVFLPGEVTLVKKAEGELSFEVKSRGTLLDVNKDGFLDFLSGICRVNDTWQNQSCDLAVYHGTGSGFVRASYDLPGNLFKSRPTAFEAKTDGVLQDFNADGLPDYTHGTCEVAEPDSSQQTCRTNVTLNRNPNANLLSKIENRYGASLAIQYGLVTDSSVYQSAHNGVYPNIDFQLPIAIVKNYQIHDGEQGVYGFNYQYFDAKMNLAGRGWLGFRHVRENSEHAKLTTDRYYAQNFPVLGNLELSELRDFNGNLLKRTNFTYASAEHLPGVYKIELKTRRTDVFLNGDFDYTSEKRFEYDSYGNIVLTHDIADIGNPDDDLFECSSYQNSEVDWTIGLLTNTKISEQESSCREVPLDQFVSGSDVRLRRFTYDSRANLSSEEIYRDTDQLFLKTLYEYDSVGNLTRTTSPLGYAKDLSYDEETYTFVTSKISPLNQHQMRLVEQRSYAPAFGVILKEVDVNGNELLYTYDGFGRLTSRRGPDPDGESVILSTTSYELCDNRDDCSAGSVVTTRMRPDWGDTDPALWPEKREYFDGLNRLYLTQVEAGDAKELIVEVRKEFDEQGRLVRESLPHYKGDEIPWNQVSYDIHSAPVKNLAPNGAVEQFCYALGEDVFGINDRCDDLNVASGASPGSTDVSNRQVLAMGADPRARDNDDRLILSSLQTLNSQGQMIRKETLDGSQSEYTYDRIGQILSSTDPNGAVTTYKYDSVGNVIEVNDHTRGRETQKFDRDGRLIERLDSNGTLTLFTYDQLNRVIVKELIGSGTHAGERMKALFFYDNPNGRNTLGQLSSVVWSENDEQLHVPLNYRRAYSYDSFGRISVSQLTIESPERKLVVLGNERMQSFTSKQSYLPSGQIDEHIYPDGAKVDYVYNTTLQLIRVDLIESDANGDAIERKTIAAYSAYDSMGRPEHIRFGNQVESHRSYDVLGRMESSNTLLSDGSLVDDQNFHWNLANKIYKIEDNLNSDESQDFYYDSRGRLIKAQGAYGEKTYRYDPSGNPLQLGSFSYVYNPDQPHQMASVYDQRGKNLGAFEYDRYGNMLEQPYLSDYGKRPLRKWFYSYDLEHRLKRVKFGNSRQGSKLSNYFNYDPMGQRVKKTSREGHITLYISDSYDITFVNKGHQVHTKNIMAQSEIAATITEQYQSEKTITALDKTTQKLLYNHHNVDSLAGFIERLSYLASEAGSQFLGLLPRGALIVAILPLIMLGLFIGQRRLSTQLWFRNQIHRSLIAFPVIVTMVLSGCYQGTPKVQTATGDVSFLANGQAFKTGIRYLHKNHQMSTNLVTDEQGKLISKIGYEPYGRIVEKLSGGDEGVRQKYTGKEYDEDSGLYYFGARYYDPILGRFLSPDPAWQYHSPYVYGANDPLAGRDPDGEFFWFIFIGIALGAAAGAYAGGVVANGGNLNPAQWDWSSGKTWAAIFVGAIIGGIAGGVGASMAGSGASIGAVMLTEGVFGAIEGLAIGAISGQTGVELLTSTLFGFAGGALFAGAGGALGKIGKSVGARLFKNSKAVTTSLDQAIDLPAVNIKQLRKGNSPGKVAIIGRRMDSGPNGVGVYDAAKTLQSHPSIIGKGVKVETFADDIAWEKFEKLIQLYRRNNGPDDMLPPSLVIRTELFKRNQEWAQKLVRQGYTVFDIGNPQRIPDKSPFYNIELETLFSLPNP